MKSHPFNYILYTSEYKLQSHFFMNSGGKDEIWPLVISN